MAGRLSLARLGRRLGLAWLGGRLGLARLGRRLGLVRVLGLARPNQTLDEPPEQFQFSRGFGGSLRDLKRMRVVTRIVTLGDAGRLRGRKAARMEPGTSLSP